MIKKLIFISQIIVYSPLIILIIILSPIIEIKIIKLKKNELGSLSTSTELFLLKKKNKIYKNNQIFLWFAESGVIANNFIFEYRKKQLWLLPGFILYPIQYFFFLFKSTRRHIYYKVIKIKKKINDKIITTEKIVDESYYDNYNLLTKFSSTIKFSNQQKEIGKNFLASAGIDENKKFVCFGVRTKFFKKETFNSVRNSSITNQLPGINYLIKNGYKAVRMGKDEEKLDLKNFNIFDYGNCENNQDFLDFYITSKCEFFISGDTGLNELATVMRKPKLILDFINFHNVNNINHNFCPLILPKKIYSTKKKSFLKYSDIFKDRIHRIDIIENYPNDLKLIDNDQEEILKAIHEMRMLIELKNFDLDDFKKQQRKFWDLNREYNSVENNNLVISPSFFNKYIHLFTND